MKPRTAQAVIEREFGVPKVANARVFHDVQCVIEDEGTVMKAVVIGQKPNADRQQGDEHLHFQQRDRLPGIVPEDHLIPANRRFPATRSRFYSGCVARIADHGLSCLETLWACAKRDLRGRSLTGFRFREPTGAVRQCQPVRWPSGRW